MLQETLLNAEGYKELQDELENLKPSDVKKLRKNQGCKKLRRPFRER